MSTDGYPRRDDSWSRPKRFDEKWPVFSAEIPPEIAFELDSLIRRLSDGPRSRASMVRSGLRLYLNAKRPEPPEAIEGTATDIIDLPELETGASPGDPD